MYVNTQIEWKITLDFECAKQDVKISKNMAKNPLYGHYLNYYLKHIFIRRNYKNADKIVR